jgi:hypothetical protein
MEPADLKRGPLRRDMSLAGEKLWHGGSRFPLPGVLDFLVLREH